MTRRCVTKSLRKSDIGRTIPKNSEIILVEHSEYGLAFGIFVPGPNNIIALYNDLADLEFDKRGYSFNDKGITPEMAKDSIPIRSVADRNFKFSIISNQEISKKLLKGTRVLYGKKTGNN